MAQFMCVILAFVLTVVSCLPADHVWYKRSDGPRYQYVTDDNGNIHLQDLWVKTSDLLKAARFNPATQIYYHLFTRQNPTESQPIMPNNVDQTNFDPRRRTVMILHGWNVGGGAPVNRQLVPAYLAAEDVNAFVVDWSAAFSGEYVADLENVFPAATGIAGFINWLNLVTGASISRYHIIGHGFGGHLAGMVGRLVSGEVPYITGLDPTLIGFINGPNNINPRDGAYTEVIHTNAFGFGYVQPLAHVDFYPNGGIRMAGCNSSQCDHARAFEYMAESIRSGGFTGRRCENTGEAFNGACSLPETLAMGGITPKTGSTGIFHLTTNGFSPFSRG